VLLSGSGITALVVDGDSIVIARERGKGQSVVTCLDLREGKQRELGATHGRVLQLVAGDGTVSWIEERLPALPAARFVAAAGPMTAIRSLPGKKAPAATVAVLRPDVPTPRKGGRPAVELLGIGSGRVFWLERRDGAHVTVVRRSSLTGGEVETIVTEPGMQEATLLSDALLWTGYSLEAALSQSRRAVKRQALTGNRPRAVADWIGPEAMLFGSAQRAYAEDKEVLWRLGRSREEQRAVATSAGLVEQARVVEDEQYLLMRDAQGRFIAKRPLSWWARMRQLLGA